MCGRTVLHKAVLHKNTDVIKYLVSEFPNLLNTRDNFGRTPLHYAQLFLEGKVLEDMMSSTSADLDSKDIMGRTPSEYNCEVCGKRKFCELQKEVTDTELDVFLIKTGFEDKLKKAIQIGNLEKVKKLVTRYKSRGDIKRYSFYLFDSIDHGHDEIAMYLILQGMNTDVYKQYETCDPRNQLCAMLECNHSLVSFKDRARELNRKNLLQFLDELAEIEQEASKRKIAVDVKEFSKFGLL